MVHAQGSNTHGCVVDRIGESTYGDVRAMAEETGIPHQILINLYLREWAVHKRKLDMRWASCPPALGGV